jgi:tyrosyl-tRNA synthetase
MSKSLGNAIGITEPPLEMYGKLMSISDELMWRYYELLTDSSTRELQAMQGEVTAGKLHPMQAKKELAARIVTDFHSAEAAKRAGEDWARQFQKDETPEDLRNVRISSEKLRDGKHDGALRWDKILLETQMAESASDAQRKIKQGAVRKDGEVVKEFSVKLNLPAEFVLRVGRAISKVTIS